MKSSCVLYYASKFDGANPLTSELTPPQVKSSGVRQNKNLLSLSPRSQ